MVYVKHWPEFHSRCIELYKEQPQKARYLIKVHPSSQWLILKVTNDEQTLKYRTRSTVILNRFETFNTDMMASIAGKELPSLVAATAEASKALNSGVDAIAEADAEMKDGTQPTAAATGASGGTSGGGGGGGGGKKKKKKGKK